MQTVLLTGGTGFLGREVLARLLAQKWSVWALLRPKGTETSAEARDRLLRIVSIESGSIQSGSIQSGSIQSGSIQSGSIESGSLEVVFGDVTKPDFGLEPSTIAAMLRRANGPIWILHAAAEVRFDVGLDKMRVQNVLGTRHALGLAERLRAESALKRLDYVSTSFVAGDRVDLVREDELDVGQTSRNFYEKTKLEAELEVRRAQERGLAAAIYRPSIVVGDSRTGRASSFKVLYWPLKVYARGRFRTLFGRPDCTVDVVPVDFVADAMVHLMGRKEAIGGTYHLAAGPTLQATIADLADMAARIFGQKPIRYVDPDFYLRWLRPFVRPILKLFRPDVADRGALYLPYFRANPSFCTERAEAQLALANIRPLPVLDYFESILRYALEVDFRAPA